MRSVATAVERIAQTTIGARVHQGAWPRASRAWYARPMRGKWARFRALPARERRLLIEAMAVLPAVVVALRWLSFRRVAAFIASDDRPAQPRDALPRARRLADLVDTAARHAPLAANCLTRSLALCWVLRRERLAGQLHIGVRREGGVLLAHAWVEVAGEPINDRADVRAQYAAFDRDLLGAIAGWA